MNSWHGMARKILAYASKGFCTHDIIAAGGMRRARQGNLSNCVWQLASSMQPCGYKKETESIDDC